MNLVQNARGESSGDAYVELGSEEEVMRALALHRSNFGHRYLEIFRTSRAEVQDNLRGVVREVPPVLERPPDRKPVASSSTLRLRGLPFHVGNKDIVSFFRGFQLLPELIQVVVTTLVLLSRSS